MHLMRYLLLGNVQMLSLMHACCVACTGEKGKGRSGKPLHFKGSTFHRALPCTLLCWGQCVLSCTCDSAWSVCLRRRHSRLHVPGKHFQGLPGTL